MGEAFSKNISPKLSDEELLAKTKELADRERRITVEVLLHLQEIERRRAFARLGYPNLWEYALKELKYSESAAYRRISAMRALKALPALEERIQAGALSVTTVSQVQTFLRAEREHAHKHYSDEQRAELFRKCENKSTREVTRELVELSPLAFRVQKERLVSDNRTIVSFLAGGDLIGKIHRVRDLSVRKLSDPASYSELFDLMSDVTLDEIDPLRKEIRPRKNPTEIKPEAVKSEEPLQKVPDKTVALIAPQPTESVSQLQSAGSASFARGTRRIPASLRRQIWQEFGGRCAYVSAETGKRCNSTFGLEIEHCKPQGWGGSSSDPENLRLLCRSHNQWTAIQSYGLNKMEPFLESRKDHGAAEQRSPDQESL